jgi:hypothetical protein
MGSLFVCFIIFLFLLHKLFQRRLVSNLRKFEFHQKYLGCSIQLVIMKEKRFIALIIATLILFGACIDFGVKGKSELNTDKVNKEDRGALLDRNTQQQYLCAFFYPWYGPNYNHWNEGGHNPPATWASNYLPDLNPLKYDPATELYSSNDLKVISWQINQMKRANIQVAISSWFGPLDYTDKVFREIINFNSPIKWCIYYEKEGYSDPSEAQLFMDINYVLSCYGNNPNYFKMANKPVVFVYGDPLDGASYAQRWKAVREQLNIFTVLKVFPGYERYVDYADSWHQYAPDLRFERQGKYSAFVSPGFWKYDKQARLKRDVAEFDRAMARLASCDSQFLLIETWNEWHEGTQIEPGQLIDRDKVPFTPAASPYGATYIEIVAKYF